MYMSSCMRRKYSHPVAEAMIVNCPEVSWTVVVYKSSVTWMYSVNIRLVIRTDLCRSVWPFRTVRTIWTLSLDLWN